MYIHNITEIDNNSFLIFTQLPFGYLYVILFIYFMRHGGQSGWSSASLTFDLF